MASSLIRPWHLGQARAGPVRSGSALAAAGSSVGGFGAILGLHGLAAASTPAYQFDRLMGELRIIAPVLGRTVPLARG